MYTQKTAGKCYIWWCINESLGLIKFHSPKLLGADTNLKYSKICSETSMGKSEQTSLSVLKLRI